jgi:hypothetical protein
MATDQKNPSDLIFDALCLRYRATTNVSRTMTQRELQEATGLAPEALMDALKVLCGPAYDHDLRVRFVDGDAEKITLGRAWLGRCEGTRPGA